MPWGLAETIDVNEIVKTGDVESVNFYTERFIKANFTDDDYKHFNSKGALNAFLLFQLSAEYYMAKKDSNLPQVYEVDAELKAKHEEDISIARQTVQKYKENYDKLNLQNQQLQNDIEKQNLIISKMKNKLRPFHKPKNMEETEPGLIHEPKRTKQPKQEEFVETESSSTHAGDSSSSSYSEGGEVVDDDNNNDKIEEEEEEEDIYDDGAIDNNEEEEEEDISDSYDD